MKRPLPHTQNDIKGNGGWRNRMAGTCDSVIVMRNPVVRHGAYTELRASRHTPGKGHAGSNPHSGRQYGILAHLFYLVPCIGSGRTAERRERWSSIVWSMTQGSADRQEQKYQP